MKGTSLETWTLEMIGGTINSQGVEILYFHCQGTIYSLIFEGPNWAIFTAVMKADSSLPPAPGMGH